MESPRHRIDREGEVHRVYANPIEKWMVPQMPCGANWWMDSIGRRRRG
ncbi:hypothetical protein ACJIZ3_006256 [Penstemon smallii]|uniref:Uncharacterized protein n=1 Tax=Penstemon smallii TaxID=265156 RepID=A0ABD3S7C3_9LAMI